MSHCQSLRTIASVTHAATANGTNHSPGIGRRLPTARRRNMATGETGFSDVFYDLVSLQYHALKAGQHYDQYVRDARNRGFDDIAGFFEQVMKEDSERAAKCHQYLAQLSGTQDAGPAAR
jgi:hypothetical protein